MKRIKLLLSTLLILCGMSCTHTSRAQSPKITNFKECVAAGFPIYRTYPPRCRTPDGLVFSDEVSAGEYPDKVNPKIGDKICKDLCGDGTCQEIVCMGSECPCPENLQSCPNDCKSSASI